jgi:hypothetical protein
MTCDPGATSRGCWAITQTKKTCKSAHSVLHVTPSLPTIQHRQQKILICKFFQAL